MARRVVEVRRAEGRRRLRVLLGALGVLALVGVTAGVLESPLGRVRHVRVAGAGPLPTDLVVRAAGIGRDTPMVSFSTGAAAARLEAIPLVATAEVGRSWPSTVRIALTLRRAVAVATPAGAVATPAGSGRPAPAGTPARVTVDVTGRVLTAGTPAVGLPVVVVPGADLPAPGGVLPGAGSGPLAGELSLAATVARVLPAPTAAEVTSISAAPGGLVATVRTASGGPVTVRFGPPADAATEAAQVAALAAVLAAHPPPPGAALDLEVPERPVVVPAAPLTSATSPATVSTQARG